MPPEDTAYRDRLLAALGDAYQLEAAIGQGGFGRVYAAQDLRLGRHVAIKVIRPDLAGAAVFLERFRREGVALARLRHPGVIPIYDIREVDGLIFYVMPFIEGDTLRRRLETRGALPPKVAHRVLLELCDAVWATHRAGIVHRDIKPENVILEGRQDKVLLMDFGIAKVIDYVDATASGMVVGTPTYMAPEQLGDSAFVDQRADIYSLGAVAYHMLTGRPPFLGASHGEIMRQHLTERPVPLRTINPSVPMLLADVVEQCLEKDPLDRFEDIGALWDQLQHVTFLRESPDPVADPPPLVGPMTALCGVMGIAAAALAVGSPAVLATIERWQYWTVAAGFALLGAATSPALRDVPQVAWMYRVFGRR